MSIKSRLISSQQYLPILNNWDGAIEYSLPVYHDEQGDYIIIPQSPEVIDHGYCWFIGYTYIEALWENLSNITVGELMAARSGLEILQPGTKQYVSCNYNQTYNYWSGTWGLLCCYSPLTPAEYCFKCDLTDITAVFGTHRVPCVGLIRGYGNEHFLRVLSDCVERAFAGSPELLYYLNNPSNITVFEESVDCIDDMQNFTTTLSTPWDLLMALGYRWWYPSSATSQADRNPAGLELQIDEIDFTQPVTQFGMILETSKPSSFELVYDHEDDHIHNTSISLLGFYVNGKEYLAEQPITVYHPLEAVGVTKFVASLYRNDTDYTTYSNQGQWILNNCT